VKAVILPMLSEKLRQESRKEGERTSAAIEVDDQMEASLGGVHFEYEPKEAVPQKWAGRTESTEWSWQVSPTSSGPEELTLKLTPLLNIEGTLTASHIESLERKVDVTQPWWQRLSGIIGASSWQWLWAVLLAPAAAWGWGMYKRRRERQEEGENS
jgi:hypothetical protein